MKYRRTLGNLLGSAGVPARRARRLAGHIFQNFYIGTTDATDYTDWQMPSSALLSSVSSVQSVVKVPRKGVVLTTEMIFRTLSEEAGTNPVKMKLQTASTVVCPVGIGDISATPSRKS